MMSFDIETGSVCDAMEMDGLRCYPTEVVGKDVFVHVDSVGKPKSVIGDLKKDEVRFPLFLLFENKGIPFLSDSPSQTVVIVGGGVSGRAAAEALRDYGETSILPFFTAVLFIYLFIIFLLCYNISVHLFLFVGLFCVSLHCLLVEWMVLLRAPFHYGRLWR